LIFGSSAALSQQSDALRQLEGQWTIKWVAGGNSKLEQVQFHRNALNRHTAALPFFPGLATITVSDGTGGSDIKVSGTGFDCLYVYSSYNENQFAWTYKRGEGGCPPSAKFLRVSLPRTDIARTDTGVLECDRLAASPLDSRRPIGIPGIPMEKIDASEAVRACQDDLNSHPNNPRIAFQRARALVKAGSPAELSEATRLYRLAAEQGYTSAQRNLADLYRDGSGGLQQNDYEAARLYRLAADRGNAGAQYSLGYMYDTGRGVPKDDREAVHFYELAVEQGDAGAHANLGGMYANGRGVPKDDRETVRLYRVAANQGNAAGQRRLGFMYESGRGVVKDEREAARLYEGAAEQGDAVARTNLAVLYEGGRGVTQNYEEAARLYRRAAEQKDARAQYRLGIFYENGRGGLPKNDREAARLYGLAANQGNQAAQAALTRLNSEDHPGAHTQPLPATVPAVASSAQTLSAKDDPQSAASAQSNLGVTTGALEIKNTADRVGTNNEWKWTAYMTGPPEQIAKIHCVRYTLHPTFPDPVREVCGTSDLKHPFALSASGWGTFNLRGRILFKDGSSSELTHFLKF